MLDFIFKRLCASVLGTSPLPEHAEESILLLILEFWDQMKANRMFTTFDACVQIFHVSTGQAKPTNLCGSFCVEGIAGTNFFSSFLACRFRKCRLF